ncbi:MAG: chemotaxis protein CheB [Gallionella sp.]|nr:chemotaxis protein CheB [Gallionella sp.]
MPHKVHNPDLMPNGNLPYKGEILTKKAPPEHVLDGSTHDTVDPTLIPEPKTYISFPIVAIGASAGGLEAIESFLNNVPSKSGMAYIVIQHLDPDHKALLSELLQRVTPMPVSQIVDSKKIQPDHVYVIPPNRDISILQDKLHLLSPVAPRGLRLPIDFFLRSLALDMRHQAVAVILSGMGSDGTLGILAIKENCGLVVVQDPLTSKFDSMPRHAIDTGMVDIVAPAELLPQRILECLNHDRHLWTKDDSQHRLSESQQSSFDKICILIRARTKQDFSHYKKSTVFRRIERRLAIHHIARISDYMHFLQKNDQEIDLLFKELLIGVTQFFRDPPTWVYLQAQVLPKLLTAHTEGVNLRAWVAGCSTGEEAYTLAMVFSEVLMQMKLRPEKYTLQIFATDLDPDAIEKARQGVYPANITADVSDAHLIRYFNKQEQGYQITKAIREMVVFATQNIIMDPPFTKLDLLCCRNLLIYLDADLQKRLIPLFHYSLRPGATLMLGSAETIGNYTELFSPIDSKARIYRRNERPQQRLNVEFPTRYPLTKTNTMHKETTPQTPDLQNLADQLVQRQFSPAAVLVSASGDLVYINGKTGRYLEPPSGKVNWNIHAMAKDGLRDELAIALPKALRDNEDVICRNLFLTEHGSQQAVTMTVHPIQEPLELNGMALIVFVDVDTVHVPTKSPDMKHNPEKTSLIRAQQELKAVREEMQTSQEELRSTNEELQSTNEELQSSNEELTTSKEEMQSLNEELQTVNAELQSKVDELSAASNDMKNLLDSTDIATIFLDNDLHLRRFTKHATRLFKLIPGDIGRPLSDIVSELNYPELLNDLNEVLRTLAYSEKEVSTHEDRWFQVKIMPYRTLENMIHGVVITFNDITIAKHLESRLRTLAKE